MKVVLHLNVNEIVMNVSLVQILQRLDKTVLVRVVNIQTTAVVLDIFLKTILNSITKHRVVAVFSAVFFSV